MSVQAMSEGGRTGSAANTYRGLIMWRMGIGIGLLATWEITGRLTASRWLSRPGLIIERLGGWVTGDLAGHIAITLSEMALGLGIGVPLGVAAGLLLGRFPIADHLLRPLLALFYSLPLIAIGPLLIMYLGFDMAPKVVLVAFVTSFIMLSTTQSGVATIDEDIVRSLELMGANKTETMLRVILPATLVWVMAGLRVALPISLVAASVGEMLAARKGLGFLLMDAANQFDIVSLYGALTVMLVLGLLISLVTDGLEKLSTRWRYASV